MNIFKRVTLLIISTLFLKMAIAAEYTIQKGAISDHGDPSIQGSIAWYLQTYGANNTYILAPGTNSWVISTTLKLPEGATLKAESLNQVWLRAGHGVTKMIELSDNTTVSNLLIDANNKAYHAVFGGENTDGSDLKNVTLNNNKIRNSYSSITENECIANQIRSHLVRIWNADGVHISNNIIQNAGLMATGNPVGECAISASGLSLLQSKNIIVDGNTIQNVGSAGVDITNSTHVTINNNTITSPGANKKYYSHLTPIKTADGVTGYRNQLVSPAAYLYRTITNNTITDYGNHGIHVSGKHHTITGNTIKDPYYLSLGSAIDIADRPVEPIQCSSNIWIQNNILEETGNGGSSFPILIDYYKATTIWISGNTYLGPKLPMMRHPGCDLNTWEQ